MGPFCFQSCLEDDKNLVCSRMLCRKPSGDLLATGPCILIARSSSVGNLEQQIEKKKKLSQIRVLLNGLAGNTLWLGQGGLPPCVA